LCMLLLTKFQGFMLKSCNTLFLFEDYNYFKKYNNHSFALG
jgi:hypothetical protein